MKNEKTCLVKGDEIHFKVRPPGPFLGSYGQWPAVCLSWHLLSSATITSLNQSRSRAFGAFFVSSY